MTTLRRACGCAAGAAVSAGDTGRDIMVDIIGTEFNDNLSGTGQDDAIRGNLGDDQLAGGAGNDSFIFAVGDGHDTIIVQDYASGDVDGIVIEGDLTLA